MRLATAVARIALHMEGPASPRSGRLAAALCASLLVPAALSGCGGSDTKTTAAARPATQASTAPGTQPAAPAPSTTTPGRPPRRRAVPGAPGGGAPGLGGGRARLRAAPRVRACIARHLQGRAFFRCIGAAPGGAFGPAARACLKVKPGGGRIANCMRRYRMAHGGRQGLAP